MKAFLAKIVPPASLIEKKDLQYKIILIDFPYNILNLSYSYTIYKQMKKVMMTHALETINVGVQNAK
mgnify:CR=1 FL=1